MLRSWAYLCVAVPLIIGCGGSDRPKLYPLTGVVKYKGEPLAEGIISFLPEKGRPSSGTIVKGAITDVTTFDPNDGLPAGKHTVTVTSVEKHEGTTGDHKSLIPVKYSDRKLSGLSVTIEAGKANKWDVDLTDK